MEAQATIVFVIGILLTTTCPIGIIFTLVGVIPALRGRRAKNWPSTMGSVIHSGISAHYDVDSGTTYGATVVYQYSVGGQTYHSSKMRFGGGMTGGRGGAMRKAAEMPVGASAQVYYNPEKPSDAVLDTSTSGVTMIFLGIGVLFLLVSCVASAIAAVVLLT